MLEMIRKLAKEKNLPLAKIEQACGLGKRTIYKWDEAQPSVDKVIRVARYLGVPVEMLIEEDEYDFG